MKKILFFLFIFSFSLLLLSDDNNMKIEDKSNSNNINKSDDIIYNSQENSCNAVNENMSANFAKPTCRERWNSKCGESGVCFYGIGIVCTSCFSKEEGFYCWDGPIN